MSLAAEMVARGFGMEADAFARRMHLGPHLLAPTGKWQHSGRAEAGTQRQACAKPTPIVLQRPHWGAQHGFLLWN